MAPSRDPERSFAVPEDPRALLRSEDVTLLRRGPRRATYRWRSGEEHSLVIKVHERGRGLRRLARPGRAEYEALRRLGAAGLRVPAPLALHADAEGELLVLEDVRHSSSLRQRLLAAPHEARRWLPEVLALTLGLHTRGWYHRDLYLDHLIVEEDARGRALGLCLLDLGRARHRWRPRRRWFVKDLAALLHSLPPSVGARPRLRFLLAYLRGRGLDSRRARRRWLRDVRAKARRMAAHTPRGGVSVHEGVEVVS